MIHELPKGAISPNRKCFCIKCGAAQTVRAVWNTEIGRWLLAFNCRDCETHQEGFISEPLQQSKLKNHKKTQKDVSSSDDQDT